MRSERARIRTFATWPSTGAKTLARYGFHASREGDCIRCAFCGLEISGFSSWREVKTWHWQVSGKDCPLLREQQNKSEETEAKVLISRSYSKENAIGLYSNPRTERLQLLKSTTSAELGSHMCLESRNCSLLLPESVSPEIASPVKTSQTSEVASLLRDSGTASEQLVSQWLAVSDFQDTESAGAEETGCPQRRADSASLIPFHFIRFHPIPFHPFKYQQFCPYLHLLHPIPFHPIPFHPILFHPIPFYPIPFHPIPFNPIPFYPIPFHPIPFHPIPFYPIPFHPIPV
ncbi:hypothetical protein ACOMHN_009222 [Nucella lapillus]